MRASDSEGAQPAYRVSPGVLSEVVEGEAVLLHLETGRYFALNRTGTRIWQLLVECTAAPRIIAVVSHEFGVGEDVVGQDLDTLVNELMKRGLLVAVDVR